MPIVTMVYGARAWVGQLWG